MTGQLTVLLVDDDTSMRTTICRAREEEGYSVLAAGNGVDALDICRQHRHLIGLLPTDVGMPGMSGVELAEHALSLQPPMKIPFMSRDLDNGTMHLDGVLGVRPFLARPFHQTALVRKLKVVWGC